MKDLTPINVTPPDYISPRSAPEPLAAPTIRRKLRRGKSAKTLADLAFDRGYVCAVANIITTHGADVIARDVLRANPPQDWNNIDSYDKEILKKAGLLPNNVNNVNNVNTVTRKAPKCTPS
ncbi:MAG: hypothetical protein WC736_15185 [Gallionella sp.]|jgi:hypothetical protein